MKKKIISLLLTVCMCLSVGVILTACGDKEHTHTYKEEWSYDDTHHWHVCNEENCSGISGKSEHTYTNDDKICSVCNYNKIVKTRTIVTESEWEFAFNKENLKNMTMKMESISDNISISVDIKITESVIWELYKHLSTETAELTPTFEKLAFGINENLMLYAGGGDGNFDKADYSDEITFTEYYTATVEAYQKIISYTGLYSQFDFNEEKHCYFSVHNIEIQNKIHNASCEVYFFDGKLIKVVARIDETLMMTCTDFGTTVIEIPKAIRNETTQSEILLT